MNRVILLLGLLLVACTDSRQVKIEAARRRVVEEFAGGHVVIGPLTILEIDKFARDFTIAQELKTGVLRGKFVFYIASMGKIETGVAIHSDGTRVHFEDDHQAVVIVSGKEPIVAYLGHFESQPNQPLERNDPSCHDGCCAPVAPAGVVAHL
jgi:hypothetical protein